jgi:hypothetical protein
MAVNVCERGEREEENGRDVATQAEFAIREGACGASDVELLRDVDSVGRGLLMAMALYMMVNTRFLSALREELGDGDPLPSPLR